MSRLAWKLTFVQLLIGLGNYHLKHRTYHCTRSPTLVATEAKLFRWEVRVAYDNLSLPACFTRR